MAYLDEKHVSFDEPLRIQVIEIDPENVELPADQKRTRNRKLALWFLAIMFVGMLAAAPSVRRCGHRMHRHVKHKYNHHVESAEPASPIIVETNLKPSFPNIERPHHVDNHPAKRAEGSMCTSTQCTKYAQSVKSNLAPNYTAIDPCEDFSTYVCGGWRQKNDYRADQASVDVGSIMEGSVMSDVSKDLLHEILEGQYVGNASLSAANITIEKQNFGKMKSAYTACKNEDAIKAYGVKPVRDLLDELEQHYPATGPDPSVDTEGLTKALVWLAKNSVNAIVGASVTIRVRRKTDDKEPDVNVMAVGSGDFGMNSKKYYDNPKVLTNYTRSIAQMFQIIWTGQPIANESLFKDPEKPEYLETAKQIAEFEFKLVHASPDPEVQSEAAWWALMPHINKTNFMQYYYKPTPVADMDKLIPEISITKYLDGLKPADYQPKFILNSDTLFFGNLSSILKSTSRKTVHGYMQSRIISSWGGRLHKDYRWPAKIFANQQAGREPFAESERWRTCLSEVDSGLGWLLSAAFVERAFSQDAKALGDRIVSDIKAEFSSRLKRLDWMTPETQKLAAKKVVNIIQKIGYPTASPNIVDPADLQSYYANLPIAENYFDNGRAMNKFVLDKSWKELSKPVDRNKWGMTAPTVNAYYSPSGNEIVFPAGIMQLPVFSDQLPEYVSYGAFGSVAGHELTHGFDNNGAHYDENGKYADWWDNSTVANFEKKTQCFVGQFDKYTVNGPDGPVNVNGKLTLGENIADAGGIAAAYAAYQRRNAAKPDKHIPGLEMFTKEQMFFVSYSTWWCGKVRPAQAVQYIYTDPHSPADKRILGTLANSAGFREAFQCKSKTPTCELW